MFIRLIFIFFSTLFFSTNVFSDIYYCTEEDRQGFLVEENEKIHTPSAFKLENFTVKIDFINETASSEKIWLKDGVNCIFDPIAESLYCISSYGAGFSFYYPEKKFSLSQLFLNTTFGNDDLIISYGYCELF